jgi:hypothetical protein
MRDKRSVQRVSCISKCLLSHNGTKYPGVLENISLGGALVTIHNSLPYAITVGDTCGLNFFEGQELCPKEYDSMVMRISSPVVGLQFVKKNG